MRIKDPNKLAALIASADANMKELERITGVQSDRRHYDEICRKAAMVQGGTLVPEGNPDDGRFRMNPTELQDLKTTQKVTAVFEAQQHRLERVVAVAERKLKSETDPAKKSELAGRLAQAKESLSQVVFEKVSARTLSMNEIMELNQKLRREMNAALKAGDAVKAAEIRQKQIELTRERTGRQGIRTRV